MPKVLIDGNLVEVPTDALFADDGTTPFATLTAGVPGNGPTFTAEDVERVRKEEKDKLYGRIDSLQSTIDSLNEQVGGLSAEEQRRKAQAEEEQKRLEAEARAREAEELDAKSLIQRREQEFQERITSMEQDWSKRFEEEQQQRQQAEALAAKEREFSELRDYAASQVEANKDNIAPQLVQWVNGNSREEIDASITRAIETTNAIAEEMQQIVGGQPGVLPGSQPTPPVTPPGVRAVGGPANVDPAGLGQQTLTREQIADMPMDQYAKLRGQLGLGGQGNNRGLFG